ncbi:MAG: DUF1631 family protein [Pseudomonadota bacterium]
MISNSTLTPSPTPITAQTVSLAKRREILHSVVVVVSRLVNSQLDDYAGKLAAAVLESSEMAVDSKEANRLFNAGNLLKNNIHPFYHVASAQIREGMQDEIDSLDSLVKRATEFDESKLSLIPLLEIEHRLSLEHAARPLETTYAESLSRLNLRLAAVLARDQLSTSDNPFRPAVFMAALDAAWRKFDPHAESHHVMLQQLNKGIFIDLASVYQAIDRTLIDAGLLPNLSDAFQIKKSNGNLNAKKDIAADPALLKQLHALFSAPVQSDMRADAAQTAWFSATGFPSIHSDNNPLNGGTSASPAGITPVLSSSLADLQKRARCFSQASGDAVPNAVGNPTGSYRLNELRNQMPAGTMTRIEETTVDVMIRIFDTVFKDPNIPPEMKELIGYLQIPVLKAALLDKQFFFEETHPARRLINLLTKSSIGWDQIKGQSDPLYRAIQRNVDRVQDFESETRLFSEVVTDLESFLAEQEVEAAAQLAAPITKALKQEKLREATKSATQEVATRIATGEVVQFVEAFLESRWVSVLTLGYSLKEEKPEVLQDAIKTMDDLIWSVKPKFSAEQRRELITKLPSLLTTLNKWLNVLKCNDADRAAFFADLAECHASIVRAPLELSPHRQLEIAIEAAHMAAQRRLEKCTNAPTASTPDEVERTVEKFQRGMWFEFTQEEDLAKRVKLAWVSPLRSLYIFTTVHREEAFSLTAEELAKTLREEKVRIVDVDGIVDRALFDVLDEAQKEQPVGV